jgi:hypothetical protein
LLFFPHQGQLQEMMLHQRSDGAGSQQNPTVVSVSGLGQTQLTAAQLQQTTQLRFATTNQQIPNVMADGIPVGTVTQTATGKPLNTQQIHAYRQQTMPMRQHVKVLQGSGQQTTALVAASPLLKGGPVQTSSMGQTFQIQQQEQQQLQAGQNVSVATVSGATTTMIGTTTMATVVATQGQGRATQFIKLIGNKRGELGEMQTVMVKRQLIHPQQKGQMMPQTTQIFTPDIIQMQQQPGMGHQQIATLVKTSGGTTMHQAGTSVQGGSTMGMTLAQVKPGQLKATMAANPNQIRQLQQQIVLPRKNTKMTQITQVAGKTSNALPTQLFVQNSKTISLGQFQQGIRHPQPGNAGQNVLGKANMGRVIPVSVSQVNFR